MEAVAKLLKRKEAETQVALAQRGVSLAWESLYVYVREDVNAYIYQEINKRTNIKILVRSSRLKLLALKLILKEDAKK